MNSLFLSKVSYALSANIISFVVSILTTLLIPRLLGGNIEGFGFFQLYIFYEGYIGFFHLGLNDGIYLKDGGKHFSMLDRRYYASQFLLLSSFELLIGITITICAYVFDNSYDNQFVFIFLGLSIIVFLPGSLLSYILQATNRIKEYATITIASRLLFLSSIIIAFFIKSSDYFIFVIFDFLSKLLSLLMSLWFCKEIVFSKPLTLAQGVKEAIDNIKVGLNLLAANIANLLIIGMVRFGVQYKWDIVIFGIISLSISIANLLLVLINAVAMVLYPTLRQVDETRLPSLYCQIRDMLMIPVLGVLILYYPLSKVLLLWIPQYAESLHYMAILFPMCVYASKMSLLITTYMKVYRMEKDIFRVNLFGVAVACVTTIISIFICESITIAVMAILVNQMLRCLYGEWILSRRIHFNYMNDMLLEVGLTIAFVISSWYIGGIWGVVLYLAVYSIYLAYKNTKCRSFTILKTIFRK